MAKRRPKPIKGLAKKNAAAILAAAAGGGDPEWLTGMMSMAEIEAEAERIANLQAKAAAMQIGQAMGAVSDSSRQRSNVAASLYSMLGGALPGVANSIQQTYESAARNQQAAGQGFSDQFRTQADELAAQDAALLQGQGAPAMTPRTSGADALYGVGGYLPSGSLGREGAAWTAHARSLPAAAAGMGRLQINDIERAGQEALRPLSAELASVYAGIPASIAETRQNLINDQVARWEAIQKQKQEQAAFQRLMELDVLKAKTDASDRAYDREQDRLDREFDINQEEYDRNQEALDDQKIDWLNSERAGYLVNGYGDPVNRQGKPVKYRNRVKYNPDKEVGAQQGLGREAWAELKKDMMGEASKYKDETVEVLNPNFDPDYDDPANKYTEGAKYTRQKIRELLWQTYSLGVPNTPAAKRRLRRMISNILDSLFGKVSGPGAPGYVGGGYTVKPPGA